MANMHVFLHMPSLNCSQIKKSQNKNKKQKPGNDTDHGGLDQLSLVSGHRPTLAHDPCVDSE